MSTYEVNDDIFPYQCAVFIKSRWGNDWYTGSGAIIGNNDILTASHVIYDKDLGGLAHEVRVYPTYDPDSSVSWSGYYKPKWYEYYEDWDADSDGLITSGDGKIGSLYELEKYRIIIFNRRYWFNLWLFWCKKNIQWWNSIQTRISRQILKQSYV